MLLGSFTIRISFLTSLMGAAIVTTFLLELTAAGKMTFPLSAIPETVPATQLMSCICNSTGLAPDAIMGMGTTN